MKKLQFLFGQDWNKQDWLRFASLLRGEKSKQTEKQRFNVFAQQMELLNGYTREESRDEYEKLENNESESPILKKD